MNNGANSSKIGMQNMPKDSGFNLDRMAALDRMMRIKKRKIKNNFLSILIVNK